MSAPGALTSQTAPPLCLPELRAAYHSLGGNLGGGCSEDRWLLEQNAPTYYGRERPLGDVLKPSFSSGLAV